MNVQVKTAVQNEATRQATTATATGLPVVVPGTEPKADAEFTAALKAVSAEANEKAKAILLSCNRHALETESNTRDDLLNAAAECETYLVFVATEAVFKAEVKKAGGMSGTVRQYLSTLKAAWEYRAERAEQFLKDIGFLESLGRTVADSWLATKDRANSGDFLLPTSNRYKDGAAYFGDIANCSKAKAMAALALKEENRRKAKEDKGAGKDGGTVTPKGDTKQTGDLPESLQGALNAVIRAVHGNFELYPNEILQALKDCETRISVEIPRNAKAEAEKAAKDKASKRGNRAS